MRDAIIAYRGDRSQEEMGKLYGVTQQAWSLWEKGINAPNIATIKKMENDSGIPMEELFADLFNNV